MCKVLLAFSNGRCFCLAKGQYMFTENEKVVYPGHGVATIDRIILKKVAGKSAQFFELKFVNKDMTILVPVDKTSAVGIRPLSSRDQVQHVLEMLSSPPSKGLENGMSNWNKRNKEYQGKLRTGDLWEICLIYRDLKTIEQKKELSFGEKHLLVITEALLAEEIALVNNVQEENVAKQLRNLIGNSLTMRVVQLHNQSTV